MRNVRQTIFSSLKSRTNQPKLLFLLSIGVLVVLGFMLMNNTWTTTMNGPSTHGFNTIRSEDVNLPNIRFLYMHTKNEDEIYYIIEDFETAE